MENKRKKEAGITLIALVTTIIVIILILTVTLILFNRNENTEPEQLQTIELTTELLDAENIERLGYELERNRRRNIIKIYNSRKRKI